MHIAVCWYIGATGERHGLIDVAMKGALKGYSWVQPLGSYYVVKVGGEADRQKIQQSLLAVAKSVPETVHYVISPLIPAGLYTGYLPQDTWPKLNETTQP